jgi:hypothetical protein
MLNTVRTAKSGYACDQPEISRIGASHDRLWTFKGKKGAAAADLMATAKQASMQSIY